LAPRLTACTVTAVVVCWRRADDDDDAAAHYVHLTTQSNDASLASLLSLSDCSSPRGS